MVRNAYVNLKKIVRVRNKNGFPITSIILLCLISTYGKAALLVDTTSFGPMGLTPHRK